jgi:hypothetical protein
MVNMKRAAEVSPAGGGIAFGSADLCHAAQSEFVSDLLAHRATVLSAGCYIQAGDGK